MQNAIAIASGVAAAGAVSFEERALLTTDSTAVGDSPTAKDPKRIPAYSTCRIQDLRHSGLSSTQGIATLEASSGIYQAAGPVFRQTQVKRMPQANSKVYLDRPWNWRTNKTYFRDH